MKVTQVQAEPSKIKRRVGRCGRYGLYKDGSGNAEIWRGGTLYSQGNEYHIGREWLNIKQEQG